MRLNSNLYLIATAVSAALLAACSDPTSPNHPPLSVSMSISSATSAGRVLLTDIGGLRVRVPEAQSRDLRVPRLGEVPVQAVLVSAAGDTLASVAFVQEFARSSHHWIAGVVATHRPVGMCVGAQVAAAVRGSATDSLFVEYGSIPDGAVC
jgi:hypothetical protein